MRTADVVPSPCVGICALDAGTGWCDGCLRTIDEIAAWGALDNRARREVWKRLRARRASRDAAAAAHVTPDDSASTRAGNP